MTSFIYMFLGGGSFPPAPRVDDTLMYKHSHKLVQEIIIALSIFSDSSSDCQYLSGTWTRLLH